MRELHSLTVLEVKIKVQLALSEGPKESYSLLSVALTFLGLWSHHFNCCLMGYTVPSSLYVGSPLCLPFRKTHSIELNTVWNILDTKLLT